MTRQKIVKALLSVLALAVYAYLLYWLLPVAIQSRLSADHVRSAFAAQDVAPVVGNTLSGLWTLLLESLQLFGLGVGRQTFATAAALSAWVTLASVGVLLLFTSWPAALLVALTPAVLWTGVVPNGLALSFIFVALLGLFANPKVTYVSSRRRWVSGAVFEGMACAVTPAAWVLSILRAVRTRPESSAPKFLRPALFFVGFTLQASIGLLLESAYGAANSFAAFPVLAMLRAIHSEDVLAAGRVISGSGGELALGLLASIDFVAAVLVSREWQPALFRKPVWFAKWSLLVIPFVVFAVLGRPQAWRFAHPGWNTVLEDFSQNVERSFSERAIVIVRSSTEEAGLRYVDQLLAQPGKLSIFRPVNLFEPTTAARVQARDSRFSTAEAEAAVKEGGDTQGFDAFVENFILPNAKRGLQFWIDTLPNRAEGFENTFLGTGYKVRATEGTTQFLTARDPLRAIYIRARPSAAEYISGPSLEIALFERYASYHLAMAHIIEREKKTIDWDRRARGEYYAALRKVEWLTEAFQKVCVDPAKEKPPEEKSEPLDICLEAGWFHQRANFKK